jgi:hypothetical protein
MGEVPASDGEKNYKIYLHGSQYSGITTDKHSRYNFFRIFCTDLVDFVLLSTTTQRMTASEDGEN